MIKENEYRSFECLEGMSPKDEASLIRPLQQNGWETVNIQRDDAGRITLALLRNRMNEKTYATTH